MEWSKRGEEERGEERKKSHAVRVLFRHTFALDLSICEGAYSRSQGKIVFFL